MVCGLLGKVARKKDWKDERLAQVLWIILRFFKCTTLIEVATDFCTMEEKFGALAAGIFIAGIGLESCNEHRKLKVEMTNIMNEINPKETKQ